MLLFLYGEDSYRANQKLNQIKEKFKEKTDPSGVNIITFPENEFNLEKFNNASVQAGFLVSKRLIVIKNLLNSKKNKAEAEQLVEILDRVKDGDNIFIFYETNSPDKRTKLFKYLSKDKKSVQEFKTLAGIEITNWLKKYVTEEGGKISNQASQLLAAFVGDNLWHLSSELDKLIAYKKNEEINEDDVKNMVTAKIVENIFGLTDAVATGNKKTSLKLLNEQFTAGLNEHYILSMIVRQFRILTQIKSLLSQKYSEAEIVKKTKLHPFVVKKSLPQAKKFTKDKLTEIYSCLTDLDKKFKSTPLPQKTLMDLFIINI